MATFAPQEERPINYNVIVRVRNKPTPLQLNVKGEGYALSPSLLLELPDDTSLELSSSGVNTVDFGQVCVHYISFMHLTNACVDCLANPCPGSLVLHIATAILSKVAVADNILLPCLCRVPLQTGGDQRQGGAQPCPGQPRPC